MGGTGNLPVSAGYQPASFRAASCRPAQAGSLFHHFSNTLSAFETKIQSVNANCGYDHRGAFVLRFQLSGTETRQPRIQTQKCPNMKRNSVAFLPATLLVAVLISAGCDRTREAKTPDSGTQGPSTEASEGVASDTTTTQDGSLETNASRFDDARLYCLGNDAVRRKSLKSLPNGFGRDAPLFARSQTSSHRNQPI